MANGWSPTEGEEQPQLKFWRLAHAEREIALRLRATQKGCLQALSSAILAALAAIASPSYAHTPCLLLR